MKEEKVVLTHNNCIMVIKDHRCIVVRNNKKIIDPTKVKVIRTFSDLKDLNN